MDNNEIFVIHSTPKFELGKIVVTAGIDQMSKESKPFHDFICDSLTKYVQCDWGDTCDEDKLSDDEALKNGERLLAVYKMAKNITIWIITEWDRSVTTILFPDEY